MKHIFQPDGVSCGPTCIKMACDFSNIVTPSIDEICEICGTDNVVGTPPKKLTKGLFHFNVNFIIHDDVVTPYETLIQILNESSICVLRTITHNVPHWIIVKTYNNDKFLVYDPWLGVLEYTENELDNIWKIRNYYFYEIKNPTI